MELYAIYGPDGEIRSLWVLSRTERQAWIHYASHYSDSNSGIDFVLDGMKTAGYTCRKVEVTEVTDD